MQDFMLIYKGGDPEWMQNTSQEEMAVSMERWGQWLAALEAKEQLTSGGSPLEYSGKRVAQTGVVTDIAAVEFKELVSGYSIIKAENWDEAIAKDCPVFAHSGIEIEVRAIAVCPNSTS